MGAAAIFLISALVAARDSNPSGNDWATQEDVDREQVYYDSAK